MIFDRIVVVDWSANSTSKLGADSIWIADDRIADDRIADDRNADQPGETRRLENIATRSAAHERLREIVDDRCRVCRCRDDGCRDDGCRDDGCRDGDGASTLIGVDFSLGYPAGTAASLGLEGIAWRGMWELLAASIADDAHNANNRFDVAAELNRRISNDSRPFWGCPPSRAAATLTTRKPAHAERGPGEWRTVETALRAAGYRPSSSWQLLGAGAVGSQSLLGIPVLERLRRYAPEWVEIWPFTTGLGVGGIRPGSVVIAEVWPSLVPVDDRSHPVRDARQVVAVADWIRAAQQSGRLAELFSPVLPAVVGERVTNEEGWVLGADVSVSVGVSVS